VAEAAAFGQTDSLKGEVIKCFVQLRAGHGPSDALADHVRREPGPLATPAGIEFVAALPRTRTARSCAAT
jgi:acetyl-CoA synthetase